MANGENHAKETVKEMVVDIIADLKNGRPVDDATMRRVMLLQFQMIIPLFENSFMTKPECLVSHDTLRGEIEVMIKQLRPRFGWPACVAFLSVFFTCAGIFTAVVFKG